MHVPVYMDESHNVSRKHYVCSISYALTEQDIVIICPTYIHTYIFQIKPLPEILNATHPQYINGFTVARVV